MLTTQCTEALHVSFGKELCVLQTWAERRDVGVLQCVLEGVEDETIRPVTDSVNNLCGKQLD